MRNTIRNFFIFFLCWSTFFISPLFADQTSVTRWIASIEAEDVLFDSSQSRLSESSREQLNVISSKLAQLYGDFIIEITGHTDDAGDADDNLRLSHLRALSVAEYLTQKNLHHNKFMVQGKGEFSPTVSNTTETGRSQNRRVEISILPMGQQAITLLTDPSGEIEEVSLVAQVSDENDEDSATDAIDNTVQKEVDAQEENLDQETLAPSSETEEDVEFIREDNQEAPNGSAIVDDPKMNPKDESTLEEESIVKEAPGQKKYKSESSYHISKVRKNEAEAPHIYDIRKKPEAGTSYLSIGPMWNRLSNLDERGQSEANKLSKTSLYANAGWISFIEDDEEVFVTLEGFAHYDRFGRDAAAGLSSDENQWTYGGQVTIGRYLLDNLSIGATVGFSREAYLQDEGSDLNYTADFIGHAGADIEFVGWRFSPRGDVGIQANVHYFNVPLDDLDAGWRYGGGIFADYYRYRLTLDYQYSDFEALNNTTQYGRFQTYLTAYF